MFDKEIGKSVSVAIAAVLLASTMILSAIGPAEAREGITASGQATPATVRYLA